MKLSIIVASHGDEGWRELAQTRAIPSALEQGALEVLDEHRPDGNRAEVRNALAHEAAGDWLCFLDADDELEDGFVAGMAARERPRHLLTPATRYICPDGPRPPCFWKEQPLHTGNWLIVGTVVERDLFLQVGGWRHLSATGSTNEFDDWDLWIRCQQAGAKVVKVPAAVYVAHSEMWSPSRGAPLAQQIRWVEEIRQLHWGGKR